MKIRLLMFVLLSCGFIMCKSKSIVPAEQLLSYIVVMESDASPKELKSSISFNQLNYEESDKSSNQWLVNYAEDTSKEKRIKAELLNHPKVLSVFTVDEYAKYKDKENRRSKSGSIREKTATKQ